MVKLKFCRGLPVFQFLIFIMCNLILGSYTMDPEEREKIEKSIFDYYQYLGGLMWGRGPTIKDILYNNLCPTDTDFEDAHLKTMEVTLESQDCQRVPMQILELECRKISVEAASGESFRMKLAKGVNGEEYEVSSEGKRTHCTNSDTLTIDRCIDDGTYGRRRYSEIEKLFFDNREIISSLKWTAPDFTCKFLHSEDEDLIFRGAVEEKDLILESQDCEPLKMNILICSSEDGRYQGEYARGKDNDIYRLLHVYSKSKCNNRVNDKILAIYRSVTNFKGELVEPLCPQ